MLANVIDVRQGDITTLDTEAIVNSTNENLDDRSPLSERILAKAGSELKKELRSSIKRTFLI